jgi:hypothetical protein
MAQEFASRIDRGLISDATHATRQYAALLALFRRIDQGDASLSVPRYDGGLFAASNPDNQFLAQHKLSDRAVARAVDILVRDAGEPVDYAYLTVRNLGSIYEGLLENKLECGPDVEGGVDVALVNDKGERKATGSFYTPDYIVAYNVDADAGADSGRRAQPSLLPRWIALPKCAANWNTHGKRRTGCLAAPATGARRTRRA